MKSLLAATALTCALALALPASPAQAGDDMTGSQASVLITGVSAMMVVSGPLYLSVTGVRSVADLSKASSKPHEGKRRTSAGPLPDMQVKDIAQTADGGRSVSLQDPANPENTALLQWPQRQDNPAANFVPGQTVAFTPSPQGAGWMLRAEDGAVLTFVPTIEAAGDSRTTTL
ncbi:hypothetical protein ARC78_05805 [Stenotrophomonas pictorum JCM 9942]|uniref:Uncharacterized protein n=1 Tax=Stenotrophomonas pictorum JCM 9942 TaxID=1236960 RepID=A0A0R0ARI3_9GAMM|nr:hypothetical protein [Stenotrophomonas pictorum]KRG44302.1 hypothetical protein ARC78_05805 [Stenotrophomonas pictorum JCM 9942]